MSCPAGPRNLNRRNERGTALLVAVIFAMTVLAYSASILQSGVSAESSRRYLVAAQVATDAAETGVHYAISELNRTTAPPTGPLVYEATLEGAGTQAKHVRVTVALAAYDGADNDADGIVDEPDEADLFEVSSTGAYDHVSRTLRVTLKKLKLAPPVTSPVYVSNPNATLYVDGSAHLISGEDKALDGTLTGAVHSAFEVAGDPSDFAAKIALLKNKPHKATLVGEPLVDVAHTSISDLDAFAQAATVNPTVRLDQLTNDPGTGGLAPAQPGDWGTTSAPATLYSPGDVSIRSSGSGAGLLVVDGNLDISGGFTWHGLIIVRGAIVFRGGGSNDRIVGAIVTGHSPDTLTTTALAGLNGELTLDPDDATGIDIYINGSVKLQYSAEALRLVFGTPGNTNEDRYVPLSWRGGQESP